MSLANASLDELEQLTQACDPASFGVNTKEVLDETYRKAGKMDPECFASLLDPVQTDLMKIIRGNLLEGTQSRDHIIAKLHKLNVYSAHVIFVSLQQLTPCPGKASFFKPHIDTPRGENMFGSLVVVFPTPHEGGALFLRHRGQEWVFDSGRELTALRQPSIGYVAFFSDVEHEVAPVISGHRVTLTYNLYFDDVDGPGSSKDSVSDHLSLSPTVNKNAFRESFQAMLENPEFLADGGTLAFGLRHVYPISDDEENPAPLEPVYRALKGSDAIVYQTVHALGFQPMLYMYYEWETTMGVLEGSVIDKVIDFKYRHGYDITRLVRDRGGIVVSQENWEVDEEYGYENPERVEWVTPVTTFNRKERAFATYGNEPTLEVAYADLCLFVRIGKAGERLVYPSASQLREEWKKEAKERDTGINSVFWHRWMDY
jgi:hypothetical protein